MAAAMTEDKRNALWAYSAIILIGFIFGMCVAFR